MGFFLGLLIGGGRLNRKWDCVGLITKPQPNRYETHSGHGSFRHEKSRWSRLCGEAENRVVLNVCINIFSTEKNKEKFKYLEFGRQKLKHLI